MVAESARPPGEKSTFLHWLTHFGSFLDRWEYFPEHGDQVHGPLFDRGTSHLVQYCGKNLTCRSKWTDQYANRSCAVVWTEFNTFPIKGKGRKMKKFCWLCLMLSLAYVMGCSGDAGSSSSSPPPVDTTSTMPTETPPATPAPDAAAPATPAPDAAAPATPAPDAAAPATPAPDAAPATPAAEPAKDAPATEAPKDAPKEDPKS
jgi:hypothetical protein